MRDFKKLTRITTTDSKDRVTLLSFPDCIKRMLNSLYFYKGDDYSDVYALREYLHTQVDVALMEFLLKRSKGNVNKASDMTGIPQVTLRKICERNNIKTMSFRPNKD